MTQTDFVRSRANSVSKAENSRGRTPFREFAPSFNAQSRSPNREEVTATPIKAKGKEMISLIPNQEMLSPLVFEIPQRVAKSPEHFFIGFDQKLPKKRPLKFVPRTSTPKTKIPIRKQYLEGLERPKTSPSKSNSKINNSPKKSPTKATRSKSPIKLKSRSSSPLKASSRQSTPFERISTPNSSIAQTPAQTRPPPSQSPTRSSPFSEREQPPSDGIYTMALKFLNGPTIQCLDHGMADLTFNTFGSFVLQNSYWDSNDFGSS